MDRSQLLLSDNLVTRMRARACLQGILSMVLFIGLLCSWAVGRANAATYSVVDLGKFSKPAGKTGADPDAAPTQINEAGAISAVNDIGGKYGGMLRLTDWMYLGTLGGGESFATGINSQNVVVGYSHNNANQLRGFIWSSAFTDGVPRNPQMRAIGTFGGTTSEATAINDLGQVTGNAQTASLNYQAFRYDEGTLLNIGVLISSLPNSFGAGINNLGHVVGAAYDKNYSTSKAFYYNGVGIVMLGDLGGTDSFALAMNNQNVIVGYSSLVRNGVEHAFYYEGGAMVDMGTLGGGYSYALDNNDANSIVGGAFTDQANLVYHAFLYQGGVMKDLNNMLDSSGAGWVLVEAKAINNAGQIIGVGRHDNQDRGFLLIPNVPSPVFTGIGINGADVALTFTTRPFIRYLVEKRNTLVPADAWTEISEAVTGSGEEMTWTDVDGLEKSSKLYRIKVSRPQ